MTSIAEFDPRATIERQAREWLIRLDADEPLTRPEAVALREWLSRSPLHRHELTRLATFWSQANVLTELAVPVKPQIRESAAHGNRVKWPALATASIVASAILGWSSLRPPDGAVNGTYGTAIGQQQTIALQDGSSIKLNTDSQIQVSYNPHLRRIRLLRGEALFSAAKDSHRPFVVYAGGSAVRAVGTAFAVRLDGGGTINVIVTKGAVDVAEVEEQPHAVASGRELESAPAESLSRARTLGELHAGETTTLTSSNPHLEVHHLPDPELQRRLAWRQGYLIFAGEPLSQVIREVNRYSPVTVEIGDARLASVAIGGRFQIDDLDGVLDVLHTNFGIQSRQVDERTIRLEPGTSR